MGRVDRFSPSFGDRDRQHILCQERTHLLAPMTQLERADLILVGKIQRCASAMLYCGRMFAGEFGLKMQNSAPERAVR